MRQASQNGNSLQLAPRLAGLAPVSGKGFSTCRHGNTDHPSLEEQVRILTQQLQHAQKLTSLGELVSTTTHEFNNVLMTIINYAKMGLRCRDDATRDKALDKILAASQKAARITNSILGVARNRSDAFEPTDLAQADRRRPGACWNGK